jgi:hypothetical protein
MVNCGICYRSCLQTFMDTSTVIPFKNCVNLVPILSLLYYMRNSWSFCLCFLSAVIPGIHYHAQPFSFLLIKAFCSHYFGHWYQLNSTVVREHILYDSSPLKFIKMNYSSENGTVYLIRIYILWLVYFFSSMRGWT